MDVHQCVFWKGQIRQRGGSPLEAGLPDMSRKVLTAGEAQGTRGIVYAEEPLGFFLLV